MWNPTMRLRTTFHVWISISLLCICVDLISAFSDSDSGRLYDVNICTNQEHLRCPDGHVISFQEISCGGQRQTCITPFNKSLHDICHGHQTCSNLGLRDVLDSQCADHLTGRVNCKFRCVPGKTAKCRTNICAQDSPGLMCPHGSFIHVRRVSCSDGSSNCAWVSYNLITSLCEQSGQCEASGLRALLSSHCRIGDSNRQVLVEYLCVPAKLSYNSCSSYRYRPISTGFGVLRSPKKKKSDFSNKQCKWMIGLAPNKQNPIRVNVLLVQSKVSDTGCNPNFLRIQLMDCGEKKVLLRSLCNLQGSSIHLTSCGPIKITSSGSPGDGSSDFIVSYESFPDSDYNGYLSSGLSACVAPPPPIPSVLTLPSQTDTRTHKALQDSGQDDLVTEGGSSSGSFKISLKILLIYIFLGALCLILFAALITVLIRYHKLPSNKYADSSENVILWKRYEDTAMDIFQQNGLVDHHHHHQTGPSTSNPEPISDQVIATVHRDPVPDQEDLDHRVSVGSGISSFLPLKRDSGFKDLLESFQLGSCGSYANNDVFEHGSKSPSKNDYYELPEQSQSQDFYQKIDRGEDGHFKGHYSNPNSLSRPSKSRDEGEHHLVDVQQHTPLVSPEIYPRDNYHYCVNNDEYAVVNKSRKPSKTEQYKTDAKPHTPNGIDSSGVSVDFRPTSGPYDRISHSSSNSSHRRSKDMMWREDL